MTSAIFLSVLVGWIGSVVLHEYAHARVAYAGGDTSVVEKGYLSLNPLRYLHPMTSFVLPVIVLALGGIPLPGGAVYIDTSRLRSRGWDSLVSAAGPAANLVLLIVFAAPFYLGFCDDPIAAERSVAWLTLAVFCYLQVLAILLNLLPIPPLDGWGILEPFLSYETRMKAREFGNVGFFVLVIIFFTDNPVKDAIFHASRFLTELFRIPGPLIGTGFQRFLDFI